MIPDIAESEADPPLAQTTGASSLIPDIAESEADPPLAQTTGASSLIVEIAENGGYTTSEADPPDTNSPPAKESSVASISPTFLWSVGLDLVDALVSSKDMNTAITVMRDLSAIRNLDNSCYVSILVRRAESLLYLHDQLQLQLQPKAILGSVQNGKTKQTFTVKRKVSDLYERNRIREQLLSYAEEAVTCTQQALERQSHLFENDILEPLSLSPILELQAASYDRLGKFALALDAVQHASIICERNLSSSHAETVRIMLEGLRLHICSSSTEDYKQIGVLATDISRRLDKLAKKDPIAADQLSRKCAELVALSNILEQGLAVVPDMSVGYSTNNNLQSKQDQTPSTDDTLLTSESQSNIHQSLFGLRSVRFESIRVPGDRLIPNRSY